MRPATPLLVVDPATGIVQRFVGRRKDAAVEVPKGESIAGYVADLEQFRRRGAAAIPQEKTTA